MRVTQCLQVPTVPGGWSQRLIGAKAWKPVSLVPSDLRRHILGKKGHPVFLKVVAYCECVTPAGAETGLTLAFLNVWWREKHSWGFWRTPVSGTDGMVWKQRFGDTRGE